MKKNLIFILFTVVMLFTMSTVSMADPISVGDQIKLYQLPGDETNGGPFAVKSLSGTYLFTTFCLERNEYINNPLTIDSITDAAINGGVGGGDGTSDPLDERTAFLYYQFRSGVSFDLNALQVAIWKIENELDNNTLYSSYSWYSLSDDYITMATDAVTAGWTNDGRIAVMNLVYYDADGNKIDAQSQLTYVPEPLSLILLGFGLFGLGMTRKLKK